MNITFPTIRRPQTRTDIARMSQTINVTDLLQGLMAHIGIKVGAADVMSIILKKLKQIVWHDNKAITTTYL